jgi:hypothetical protein
MKTAAEGPWYISRGRFEMLPLELGTQAASCLGICRAVVDVTVIRERSTSTSTLRREMEYEVHQS